MRLASIPADVPFLDTLAARWRVARAADPSRGLILLPTRRAARALAEAFLRAAGGAPMLLPRIAALGALDEAPLALAGALALPPAVEAAERQAVLARLVLALPEDQGGARTADRAWRLAAALADLMDEAEWAEIDLPAALAGATDAAHAAHWQITLRFLGIATRAWPEWLAERQLTNPVARQVALLRAQAEAWQAAPPADPVWVAGTAGALPAVAALLRTVAQLPNGCVILPGLDAAMEDAHRDALDTPHPQAALHALLRSLGAAPADVQGWQADSRVPEGRAATLAAALLPAACLDAWRAPHAPATAGLFRLAPADPQEEAVAIALILRDALETPGRRAALVTPDRALAVRVSAELLRWGVVADDSAGETLAVTPPAVFLRLLARAVAEGLAPVALLSLLKHPLAAAGLPPARCRDAARTLETFALRGPRPPSGFAALHRHAAASDVPASVTDLLARLETCLAPLARVMASVAAAPSDLLAALIEAGEGLAASDEMTGPARLWGHEEGEALAATLAAALAALPHLPDQPPSVLPGLLDALLEGAVVRSRRALRGRDHDAEHPRVFIWGLLEARLQAVDVMVLGGLAEGVWPPATDPGPWLSRPMRAEAGLRSPEEAVGLAAHDFVMAACAAPAAVLSCPERRDGAPAVPARWLTRLEAFLAGRNEALPRHPAAAWARALDRPAAGGRRQATEPQPRPPAALRPRRLYVTEIATWIADPYAIYARHVLRLLPLDPLEQATDAADYGTLVHAGMHRFLGSVGAAWPTDAEARLKEAMDHALRQDGVRPALFAWWAPRLHRIAAWVATTERDRRARMPPLRVAPECQGQWPLDVPGGGFLLVGRADRIERRPDGRLAILDYKTGFVPGDGAVEDGAAPQLPLEAAMATAGAFGAEFTAEVAELTYWKLGGGQTPGEEKKLFGGDPAATAAAAGEAEARLRALIAAFDDARRPYLNAPHPGRLGRGAYDQLARRAEWAGGAGDE